MSKKTQIIEMAERIKKAGNIDGIGMQSHLDCRDNMQSAFPSISMYESALKDYVATGLDVQITELDVTVPEQNGAKYFDHQAEYYKGIMNAIEKYKDNVSAVIFWGVNDTKSWRAKQLPLLFGDDFMAKPAFDAIVEGKTAGEEPARTTKANGNTSATTTTTSATTTSAAPETTTSAPDETTTAPVITSGALAAKVYGDANCDDNVDVSDAVIIMQSISNPSKYSLTAQGKANGDVNTRGDGITNADALSIQKYKLQLIKKLPESFQ